MSRKERKHSNSQDGALFREAMGDTTPLETRKRHLDKPQPPAKANSRRRDERAVMAEAVEQTAAEQDVETGEQLYFRRSGIDRRTMRKLKRGEFSRQAELDLHGMTSEEAREALHEFLLECVQLRLRCVRVVHGKGLGSGMRGPVLKNGVNNWLRRWQPVLAFCSAPPNDGGTGAAYVLLAAS